MAWKKCVIIALDEEGFSTRKIAEELNRHLCAVSRMIKLKCKTGNSERKM